MREFLSTYKIHLAVALIAFVSGAVFLWIGSNKEEDVLVEEEVVPVVQEEVSNTIIGYSVEGRVIEAYHYGEGEQHLVFVGGIHGGYEWNSVLLAYDMMELLTEQPELVPANTEVTIIPSLNPDGLYDVLLKEGRITWDDVAGALSADGAGRMNRNGVDLNRNFDCKWQPESSWRGQEVSAGTAAFSEPEAAALRDFVLASDPAAVVFWHSQANAVYASECHDGVLPATIDLMNLYASAADYAAVESFDHYPITGDAEGWLASIGVPAITVELSSHETTDWQRNVAGVKAVFDYFAAK